MSDGPPRPGWWPRLRAVLIALHLVAITLAALPSPGEGMVREAWSDPTVQREFAVWVQRLNTLGISWSEQEFEDHLWDTASAYLALQGKLQLPFKNRYYNYYDWCGTMQSWRMFAGPHRYPSRLVIEVHEGAAWRPVYVQRDPAHAWLAWQLDEYRMRPLEYRFSWFLHRYRYPEQYTDFVGFARYVARKAARDFPSADSLRVRLIKSRTPSPEETRAGSAPEAESTGVEVDLGEWR